MFTVQVEPGYFSRFEPINLNLRKKYYVRFCCVLQKVFRFKRGITEKMSRSYSDCLINESTIINEQVGNLLREKLLAGWKLLLFISYKIASCVDFFSKILSEHASLLGRSE